MGNRIGREIMGMSERSAPYIVAHKENYQQIFCYGIADRLHTLPILSQRYLFILILLLQNCNDYIIIFCFSFGAHYFYPLICKT